MIPLFAYIDVSIIVRELSHNSIIIFGPCCLINYYLWHVHVHLNLETANKMNLSLTKDQLKFL